MPTGLDLQLRWHLGWLEPDDPVQGEIGKDRENAFGRALRLSQTDGRPTSWPTGNPCAVGEDQRQHLELARDIAQKFNNRFQRAGILSAARPDLGAATRVMSLPTAPRR